MSVIFSRRAELGVKLAVLGLLVLLAAVLALLVARNAAYEPVGEPIAQPIPFSHKHHVGDDGIDCRYCHTSVETIVLRRNAVRRSTCMTCHSQLWSDSAGAGAGVRELPTFPASRFEWQRVHDMPDFVYFNHGVHVNKGVACIECHGRVDQMPLTWRVKPLQMQWCLGCHRNPEPHLWPKEKITSMHRSDVSRGDVEMLARVLNIQDQRRLTDCSTCHR